MLEAYKSYVDPHLNEYWANNKKWKHLVRTGVVTRTGTPIDDITFRANEIKDWKKRKARQEEAERLLVRRKQIEAANHTVIQQKIEDIEKLEKVLRVKNGQSPRSRTNIRLIDPSLRPLSPRTHTRASLKHGAGGGHRASSAPQRSGILLVQEKENSTLTSGSATPARGLSRASSSLKTPPGYHVVALDGRESGEGVKQDRSGRALVDNMDDLSITELERQNGLDLGRDKKQHYPWVYLDSPYLESQMPYHLRAWHRAPQAVSSKGGRRSLSAGKSRSHASMSAGKKTHNTGNVDGNYRRVSVPIENMIGESHNWEQMEIKMKYHGDMMGGLRDENRPFDEILVEQQHCGGNTVCVFRGNVVPGEEFSFVSHRHPGYPFSLNLYVNGKKDCRVSTCCEYKHTHGRRLGSKSGQFSITGIVGGGPCRRCQLKVARRKTTKQKIVRYRSIETETKDPNDHDFYELKISVEGDEIYGSKAQDDDSNEYTDDDTDEEEGRPVRSPNTHDFYSLKVSLEDDEFDSGPHRPNSIKPVKATGGWRQKDGASP